MDDIQKKTVVLMFAGPNGSGKSTITRNLKPFGTYVNADDLKKEHNLSDLEAAQMAELLRNRLIEKKADFSFETVLSTERNLFLLKKAKTQGYEIRCIYVLTCDENINVARVKARHISGGHNVPENKVRERYRRALTLLPQLIEMCDTLLVYDNTNDPELIFSKQNEQTKISPNDYWSESEIKKLLKL